MPAIAEVPSTKVPRLSPRSNRRSSDRATCPVCADSMIAAEASAFVSENQVSYLWTCDTCGYGFVTSHSLTRFVAA
jgi:C4-type Zn-finger protein